MPSPILVSEHSVALAGSDAPLLLTVEDVGRLTSLSPRTIWRLVASGEFPEPRRIGRATRWNRVEVVQWASH